ncbi:MAG TPA: MarR family winged helix-turn-helix transcriptional regulator [Pseudonocardia sp.]|uniref:MarR family winged helix-turn-helix transcriptional regulator n=1 Tax=Pseudonocardia sp. TaxID=60912 RepID=UPI002B4AC25D|nr:MarR family winged helix-turn-helix transcriptional regulator [Pseudonocardia sp.]HLU55042.1 MarR family winged helix-turn-helix transcriptional regulator [Pseudonocardia sp.]
MTDTAATTAPNGGRPRSAPTRDQLAAWRAFLRAHASITRALEAELVAEQDLPLASYDVLVQLAEAPGGQLRMTELADAVLLSRSGLTRLVDRLERSGLVARGPVEHDGRGVVARLTEAGLARLRTASRTHLRGIAHHFVSRLDEADLGQLERISNRLVR